MIKKLSTYALFLSALGSLLFLGFWQLERLEWKHGVIEQLNAEYIKNPEQYNYDYKTLNSFQPKKIKYGQVTGRFDYSKQMLFGPKPLEGEIGYWVITPLILADNNVIFTHRGWVKEDKKNDIRQSGRSVPLTATGVFRTPDWNTFTPENNSENNVWTKLDINQMSQAQNIKNIAPVLLYAENITNKNNNLILQETKWYPRNKHRQYAIFWFAMAGAFLAVFGLFIQKRKKSN